MIRFVGIFVSGVSVGFIGTLMWALYEMSRKIDP